jgi:Methyltransferase domain
MKPFFTLEKDNHFLKSIKIVSPDNKIHRDGTKKLQQINHMVSLFLPYFAILAKQNSTPSKAGEKKNLTLIDIGCGNSYLTFCLGKVLEVQFPGVFSFIGIDSRRDVIEHSKKTVQELTFSKNFLFLQTTLKNFSTENCSLPFKNIVGVVALHACDTATDEALAYGIKNNVQFLGVAPCCQAELAQFWQSDVFKAQGPVLALRTILNSPHLRRDFGANFTDSLRLSFMRAHGYNAVATEFVNSLHTPKNRLLIGSKTSKCIGSA